MHAERISIFGLGKLGCSMLAAFAKKDWTVVGVDVLEESVSLVNRGESPIREPLVAEWIRENRDKIRATRDPEEAVMNSEVSFIIVPTPSLDDGSFSTRYVEAAVAEIGSILRNKNRYHLVVVTSTVLPGDMEYLVRLLEKTTGKRAGEETFGICYNPDFIALGSVVRNFCNPDMVLIGECDERAGRLLESIHRRLCDNDPKVCRMNFFNAELTKIALNSYCTMKISFANTIAQICGNMPGGNACSVLEALGADSRIGAKYLQGALSYGGPCFPRDNRAFSFSASRFGCEALLAKATDEVNRLHRERYVPESILEALQPNPEKIAVLGITYKPDTPVVEESAVLHAVRFFLGKGIGVNIYDPLGLEQAQKELRPEKGVRLCRSVSECLEGTEACFVATPWREFIELKADDFIKRMKKPVVVDAWNLYSREEFGEIRLLKIGIYRNEY